MLALPIYPSFGENSAIQASEESLVVSASVGCATADGMASRPFTSIPSSFYLTGIQNPVIIFINLVLILFILLKNSQVFHQPSKAVMLPILVKSH